MGPPSGLVIGARVPSRNTYSPPGKGVHVAPRQARIGLGGNDDLEFERDLLGGDKKQGGGGNGDPDQDQGAQVTSVHALRAEST
jgi:hypothetical protein